MTEPGNKKAPELGDQTATSHPDDLDLETYEAARKEDRDQETDAVEPPD